MFISPASSAMRIQGKKRYNVFIKGFFALKDVGNVAVPLYLGIQWQGDSLKTLSCCKQTCSFDVKCGNLHLKSAHSLFGKLVGFSTNGCSFVRLHMVHNILIDYNKVWVSLSKSLWLEQGRAT